MITRSTWWLLLYCFLNAVYWLLMSRRVLTHCLGHLNVGIWRFLHVNQFTLIFLVHLQTLLRIIIYDVKLLSVSNFSIIKDSMWFIFVSVLCNAPHSFWRFVFLSFQVDCSRNLSMTHSWNLTCIIRSIISYKMNKHLYDTINIHKFVIHNKHSFWIDCWCDLDS